MLLSLLGLLAAGALAYKDSKEPSYETQAKLLVRYVVERSAADPDAPVRSKGGGGSAVMDTELQILKSFDLALDTAARVGPARLLPEAPADAAAVGAAGKILGSLTAGIGNDSNVIQLSYRDTDPQRGVEVLSQLIQSYFARHLEIHRSSEAFNQVAVQTDQARNALRTTEDEINRLKSESGVLSIDATIQEFESRRQMVRETLMAAHAALAEQRAKVKALESSFIAAAGDKPAAPDEVPAPRAAEDSSRRDSAVAVADYQDLSARLEMLRQSRNQLLLRRPAQDPAIASLDRQIAGVQSRRLDLVDRYPQLAAVVEAKEGSAPAAVTSIEDERALQAALEAKVTTIAEQAKAVEKEVAGLSALGFRLAGLERHRQMADEKFRYYQSSLEKARIDETLDPTKIPNISIVQNPSSPMRSIDAKTRKLILGIAASGIGAGLMLAFLIEWVVDRRVSRPTEIQSRLQLPLMMSIPFIRSKDGMAKIIGNQSGIGLMDDSAEPTFPPGLAVRTHGKLMVAEKEHFITPYACAIRDRIMFNFEINHVTHKPKLIALTGLSDGAGTSTIAAGVARAFAETSNRKVLLVDFNPAMSGLVFPEHPAESLRRALDASKEERFRRCSQNLFFAIAATRGDGKGASFLAPATLHQMMPHIEASGFDYILFDMPPVGPTSPTLAMAGFMDKILLVLDADNTNRDGLRWGYAELQRGRADVSCIFNKAKSHAPRWVAGDF